MLRINVEFRKGVLFVRLTGNLGDDSYLESINNLIEGIGIRYVVLNIDGVKFVDVNNVNDIINYNKKILKEKKYLLICDNNVRRSNIFWDNIPNISCEIDAFSLI